MRFKKLGSEDVGEATSRRHVDPLTGQEEVNITDQDLAATPPLEDEPEFRDILPDQIQSFRSGEEEDEVELEREKEEIVLVNRTRERDEATSISVVAATRSRRRVRSSSFVTSPSTTWATRSTR